MIQTYAPDLIKMLKSFLPVVPKKNHMEYYTRVRLVTHEGRLAVSSVPLAAECSDYATTHIVGTMDGFIDEQGAGLPPVFVNLRDLISSLENFYHFSKDGFVNLGVENEYLSIDDPTGPLQKSHIPAHGLDVDFTDVWQEPPSSRAFVKSLVVHQDILREMFERALPCSATEGERRTSIVGCQLSVEKDEGGVGPMLRVSCTDGRRAADVFARLPEDESAADIFKHCVDMPAMKFLSKVLDKKIRSNYVHILMDDRKYWPVFGTQEDCRNRLWFKVTSGNVVYYVLSIDKRFPFPDMESVRKGMPNVERTFTMSKDRLHRMLESIKNSAEGLTRLVYDGERHAIVLHSVDKHGNDIRFEESGVHLDYLPHATSKNQVYGFNASLALPLVRGCETMDGKVTVGLRDPLSMMDFYPSSGDSIHTLYHLMPIRIREEAEQ